MYATNALEKNSRDLIGVSVSVRTTIFKITIAIFCNISRDSNRCCTVRDAVLELIIATGLV
jgi:hypothetical protein